MNPLYLLTAIAFLSFLATVAALAAVVLMAQEHSAQVEKLVAAFRVAVDRLGTRIDRASEKSKDRMEAACRHPPLRLYHPEPDHEGK